MGGAIGAHQTGAVQREHHRQVLDGHVVDQLVVPALQEGGIDGHHRFQALAGHARREGDRMLLGNAHVVITLGEPLVELHHAGTLAHGRGDGHQTFVGLGHVAQPLAEHLREGQLARRALGEALGRVELARGGVVLHRVGFGRLVTVALLGDHVQELRSLLVTQVLQRGHQRFQVVAVDGADVVEAELFEDGARHHHALGMLLETARQFEQRRRTAQHALGALARSRVELAAHQARQVLVQCAHGRADGHVVVVEHHQHVGQGPSVGVARVVHGLEGHARGHGAIANDGHGAPVLPLELRGAGHAQGGGDGGGTVPYAKGVVLTLLAARETADATELPQRVHAVTPPGQDLVRIGLVAHVPHQPVVRGVEDEVQRHGQLHAAEVAAEVPAGLADGVDHLLPDFVSHLAQLVARQPAQVGRTVKGGKQG